MEVASSPNNHCPTWIWSLFVVQLVKFFIQKAWLAMSLLIWCRSQTRLRLMLTHSSGQLTWTVILLITLQRATSSISWWKDHLIATQANTPLIIRQKRSINVLKRPLSLEAWWMISKHLILEASKSSNQVERNLSKTNQSQAIQLPVLMMRCMCDLDASCTRATCTTPAFLRSSTRHSSICVACVILASIWSSVRALLSCCKTVCSRVCSRWWLSVSTVSTAWN